MKLKYNVLFAGKLAYISQIFVNNIKIREVLLFLVSRILDSL